MGLVQGVQIANLIIMMEIMMEKERDTTPATDLGVTIGVVYLLQVDSTHKFNKLQLIIESRISRLLLECPVRGH